MPIFQPRRWQWIDEAKTRRVLEEVQVDFATSRTKASWTFIEPHGIRTAHSSLRLYSYRELGDLLRRAGFGTVEGLDAQTGKPFGVGSRRLGMVGARPQMRSELFLGDEQGL